MAFTKKYILKLFDESNLNFDDEWQFFIMVDDHHYQETTETLLVKKHKHIILGKANDFDVFTKEKRGK